MHKQKRTLLERLLDEHILYGGLPMTRREVVRLMTAEGFEWCAIDYFAFRPNAVVTHE